METYEKEREERQQNDEKVSNLLKAIVPYGYSDVLAAANLLDTFKVDYNDYAEWLEEYLNDIGQTLIKDGSIIDTCGLIDICGLAHEYILSLIRDKIETALKVDILDMGIYAYGNYMCSSFDNTEKFKAFIAEHKELLNDELIKTFVEYLD